MTIHTDRTKERITLKKNYLYAAITMLIWSTLAVVVKLMTADLPNFQMLTISSAVAFLTLLILNIANGSIRETKAIIPLP